MEKEDVVLCMEEVARLRSIYKINSDENDDIYVSCAFDICERCFCDKDKKISAEIIRAVVKRSMFWKY